MSLEQRRYVHLELLGIIIVEAYPLHLTRSTLYLAYRKFFDVRSKLVSAMETDQANSKTSGLKIKNHWRKIMRSAKMDELKKDVEILSQVSRVSIKILVVVVLVNCRLCAAIAAI